MFDSSSYGPRNQRRAFPRRGARGARWSPRPPQRAPPGPSYSARLPLVTARAVARIGDVPSDCSTEQAIDLRQELGEVEPGRASSTGGVEIGSVPVSLFLRELRIGFAGPAAGAMMLVVR